VGERGRPAAVGLATALLVLARLLVTGNPFRLVWSEDGLFWSRSQHGFGEWRPLAGYLNALPSLLVTASRVLPFSAYPAWCVVASCVVVGLLTAFVYVCARRLTGETGALLAAGAMALTPALRVDTLGSLANLQWFLVPACFWALIRPWPGRLGKLSAVLALTTGLSCAIAVVLVPVGLMRRAWWATAALSMGEAAQVLVVLTGPPGATRERRWPDGAFVNTLRLAGGWTGDHPGLSAVLGLTVVCTVLASLILTRRRVDAALAVGAGAALFAFTVYIAGVVPPRYVATAAILAVFGVALALPGMHRAGRWVLVSVLVLSAAVTFPASQYRFTGPAWACVGGRAHVGPPSNFADGFLC
jgi:hypothetical protein